MSDSEHDWLRPEEETESETIIDARTAQNKIRPTTVPITLKERWTSAARFAFLFVPTEESSAVTHVPMFWPMMMGMAAP